MTYVPVAPQPSCARAWLAASEAVTAAGGKAHNVVIDIADPLAEDGLDAALICRRLQSSALVLANSAEFCSD